MPADPVSDHSGDPSTDADLAQLIEELHLNAWPALRQTVLDGWICRFAGGLTRRSNSVNPVYPGRRPLPRKIDEASTLYGRAGLPVIFRIPTITPDRELDALLAARGYERQDETGVRILRFADRASISPATNGGATEAETDLEELETPSEAWMAAKARLSGHDAATRDLYGQILHAIQLPARYLAVRDRGRIVAVAVGVLEAGWMCVHSVVTDREHRRRGHSRRAMAGLLDWASGAGAIGSALGVVKANGPAIALYDRLGFTRELYSYHYRQLPPPR